jgi:hypothetical protein
VVIGIDHMLMSTDYPYALPPNGAALLQQSGWQPRTRTRSRRDIWGGCARNPALKLRYGPVRLNFFSWPSSCSVSMGLTR